ncbi:MAG: GGDEF domain-containing protein [Chloroflexi bacterium]|nr:GGDEF domain-containing protein [Chloroflexota bacterium]
MTAEQLEREIERHQETTEALRESRETVRALLDATTETALLIDRDGKILALNEVAFERLRRLSRRPVGNKRAELVGRNVFELFPPGLAERRKARNDSVIESGLPARFEDERAGQWMDNTIYPIFDAAGNVAKLAVFSYDVTDRKASELALHRALREEQERARIDPLTGALNHRAIVEELQKLIQRAEGAAPFAVLLVDVDGLKAINDSYGHPMGDAALVAIADALFRARAIVGRYGGDEFVVALPGAGVARAEQYRADVVATLNAAEVIDEGSGKHIPVMASIGIATHPDDAKAVSELIELADNEMYEQKRCRPVAQSRREAV